MSPYQSGVGPGRPSWRRTSAAKDVRGIGAGSTGIDGVDHTVPVVVRGERALGVNAADADCVGGGGGVVVAVGAHVCKSGAVGGGNGVGIGHTAPGANIA